MPANTNHYVFEQPLNPSTPIWRYFDFTKLLDMLETRSLYFPTSSSFDDPYEGTIPHANRKDVKRQKDRKRYSEIDDIQDLYDSLDNFLDWQRQWTYISSWHMNQNESAAMWRLYSESTDAVAIQSTYQDLVSVLDDYIYIGMVAYIDYQNDVMPESNMMYPFMHKRVSFRHEREVRALFQDFPHIRDDEGDEKMDLDAENPENGRSVEVDLSELIEAVYVAPSSAPWFANLVPRVIETYELDVRVETSSLARRPVF